MISYEELVAALDRYVARNGGTPQSVHASAGAAAAGGQAAEYAFEPPPAVEHGYDEHHDPDLGGGHDLASGGHDDATHVGAGPGGALPPSPAQSHGEDHSNEIDIGDVLADDELS